MHIQQDNAASEAQQTTPHNNTTQNTKTSTIQTKQGRKSTIQAKGFGGRSLQPIQTKQAAKPAIQAKGFGGNTLQPVQRQAVGESTGGGLPDTLKTNMESMGGTDLSDVKVHYNSDKPAQLQAHAYAQGSDIHLGAGQEKHLPHEAWHVVQQKQGRVQATTQMKGEGGSVGVNDSPALEREADQMGAKAVQMKAKEEPTQLKEGKKKKGTAQLKEDKKKKGTTQLKENESQKAEANNSDPSMKILGKSTLISDTIFGKQASHRYLVTGSVAQWKKLLSEVDSHHSFDKFVAPFLAAAGASYHSIDKPSHRLRDGQVFTFEQNGNISEQDILNFLLAMYDASPSTSSKVDFPDSIFEQDANTGFEYRYRDALAKFVSLHQHKLVNHLSSKGEGGNHFVQSSDVSKLATQSTFHGDISINNPKVVKAMIQSAIRSAYIGAARVFNAEVSSNFADIESERTIGLDMIKNSGLIIKGSLGSYNKAIKNLEGNITAGLGVIWGLIPVPKPLKSIFDIYKSQTFTAMAKAFKIGGEYNNMDKYKESLSSSFDNTLRDALDWKPIEESSKIISKEHGIDLTITKNQYAQWYALVSERFQNSMK